MKSVLTIIDLTLDRELGHHDLAAVRGGNDNQANATKQGNLAGMIAPVLVGNGSKIEGSANFQVDSNPTQTLTNDSTSSNSFGFSLKPFWPEVPAC